MCFHCIGFWDSSSQHLLRHRLRLNPLCTESLYLFFIYNVLSLHWLLGQQQPTLITSQIAS